MVKAKICGITKTEDAILAAKLGAWAIGFIFYPQSPRYIAPEKAQVISDEIKKSGLKTVGVFVNETAEKINETAKIAQLDYVQLHGNETASDCAHLEKPFIKNIRSLDEANDFPNAFAFLVDASDTQSWGGTGTLADWNLAKNIKEQGLPLVLSGGLSVNNIEEALSEVKPDFIDVSSSLEKAPGEKDQILMREFFKKIIDLKEIKINEQ